jgi:hypothetical protein
MHVRCAAFSLSTAERLLNEQMFIHKGGRLKRSVPSWRIFNEKSPFKFKKLLAGEETTRKKRNNTLTLSLPFRRGEKVADAVNYLLRFANRPCDLREVLNHN